MLEPLCAALSQSPIILDSTLSHSIRSTDNWRLLWRLAPEGQELEICSWQAAQKKESKNLLCPTFLHETQFLFSQILLSQTLHALEEWKLQLCRGPRKISLLYCGFDQELLLLPTDANATTSKVRHHNSSPLNNHNKMVHSRQAYRWNQSCHRTVPWVPLPWIGSGVKNRRRLLPLASTSGSPGGWRKRVPLPNARSARFGPMPVFVAGYWVHVRTFASSQYDV